MNYLCTLRIYCLCNKSIKKKKVTNWSLTYQRRGKNVWSQTSSPSVFMVWRFCRENFEMYSSGLFLFMVFSGMHKYWAPGARTCGRLNFVPWLWIFVGPHSERAHFTQNYDARSATHQITLEVTLSRDRLNSGWRKQMLGQI